jgi:two-component system phosphate regulon response regulator PhoB
MEQKSPLRVLLIEDDQEFAYVIIRLLREMYEVYSVIVETEVDIRAALIESWTVIISDHRLPTFDSYRVLEILQELHIVTPLILISGIIEDKRVAEAFSLGARAFVRKDDIYTHLIPVLRREVATAQLKQSLLKQQGPALERKYALIEELKTLLNEGWGRKP